MNPQSSTASTIAALGNLRLAAEVDRAQEGDVRGHRHILPDGRSIGSLCNLGGVPTPEPTLEQLSSDLVVYAARLVRAVRRRDDLPAGVRVLALLDELRADDRVGARPGRPVLATDDVPGTWPGCSAPATSPRSRTRPTPGACSCGSPRRAAGPSPTSAAATATAWPNGCAARHTHSLEDLATAVAVLRDLLDPVPTHHLGETRSVKPQQQPIPRPAARRVGGRLRLRDRLHGHRPGRPDPQADRRPARRHAEPGVAAVHQLHGGDGRRDADHRRGVVADRRQAHPAPRPGADRRLLGAGRLLRHHRRHRRLPRRLGPRQRPVHRHRAGDHRGVRAGLRRPRPSSCSRPRSASASPPARSSAARWARSPGARRSSASPC